MGYSITYAYERDGVNGYDADSFLYTDELCKSNSGVVPQPGNICELGYGRGGFIESCSIIADKGNL